MFAADVKRDGYITFQETYWVCHRDNFGEQFQRPDAPAKPLRHRRREYLQA